MSYTVSHISDVWNTDGSPVYEYSLEFRTWRELTTELDRRRREQNAVFCGRGFVIHRDGDFVSHSRDLTTAADFNQRPISRVSLALLRDEQAL